MRFIGPLTALAANVLANVVDAILKHLQVGGHAVGFLHIHFKDKLPHLHRAEQRSGGRAIYDESALLPAAIPTAKYTQYHSSLRVIRSRVRAICIHQSIIHVTHLARHQNRQQ